MDNKLSVHHKRSPKQTKPKKKPIKIVYISNPMKVETSASEFRALVQELTGQDSDYRSSSSSSSPSSSGFPKFNEKGVADDLLKPSDRATRALEDDPDHSGPFLGVDPSRELSSVDWLDDVFTPQMMENFTGLLPSNPLMLM
ncbi:nuclear speckle RNA-binding protein B-like [Magnolia sinica]|uniref:nuclear speckle RNA-binding protein B-like n=1 Tax=Magnolia sinica TaxID=86752 RepID=UPI002659260A|nr:nuclear speckle RNA-binding protein B-like [Magnolia sinica]